jgi:Acetyltransferase (GNAT) domain
MKKTFSTTIETHETSALSAEGEISVRIARTVQEIEALREVWNSMAYHVIVDIDFYLTFLRIKQEQRARPYVVSILRNEVPVSLLVGRLENAQPSVHLGYRKIVLPVLRRLTVDALLGEQSASLVVKALQAILSALEQGEAEAAHFQFVEIGSEYHKQIGKMNSVALKDHFPMYLDYRYANLPATLAEFLAMRSSSTRYYLKRYAKRIESAFTAQLELRIYSEKSDLERLFADCEIIAGKSYQRALGVGFLGNQEDRELMQLAAERRWLRSYVLCVQGIPRAFWNGFLYQQEFLSWATAFDPEFRDYRPGQYLLQRMIQDLCENKMAKRFLYGPGDAQYKRDCSDANIPLVSLYYFAPTLKGILANTMRTTPLAVSRTARRTLDHVGLAKKLKKLWRTRLGGPRQSPAKVEDPDGE